MDKRGYWKNILVGLDQFVGTLFGIDADETISSHVGKNYHGKWQEKIINWIFQDPDHCKNSMEDHSLCRNKPVTLQTAVLILCALLLPAVAIQAATMQYYSYPTVKRLYDNSRVLIYANASGSRNITGAQLKSEIVTQSSVNAAIATATNATPLTKRAGSGDSAYVRQLEVKDSSGTITMWINASGQMIFGTPVPLTVSSVYPANGATGLTNAILRYTTPPAITFNKSDHPSGVLTPTAGSYGTHEGIASTFNNFSGTPGVTYTFTANRVTYVQTDGETTSTCGSAMADVAGVCTSTFTMAP